MTKQSELRALLADVERATGPDRELDARIYGTIMGLRVERRGPGEIYVWDDSNGTPECAETAATVTPYTASLDACLALQERVLPGWKWMIDTETGETIVFEHNPEGVFGQFSDTLTPLLAAVLKALIEQGGE